jgi:hypothetical protein
MSEGVVTKLVQVPVIEFVIHIQSKEKQMR